MTLLYLASILIPRSVSFHLRPAISRGPMSFSGRQQKRASDAGSWVARMSFDVHTADEIRQWRGTIAALEGGANDIVVGVFDDRQAPTVSDGVVLVDGVPWSDDTTFDDGSGFSQSDIQVELASDLALRATSATVTIINAGDLRVGMYFSITDTDGLPHLYMITSIPEVSGSDATFDFLPPARVAATAGDPVEFGLPKCTMNLASPMSGELELERNFRGFPSIELEESFSGLA